MLRLGICCPRKSRRGFVDVQYLRLPSDGSHDLKLGNDGQDVDCVSKKIPGLGAEIFILGGRNDVVISEGMLGNTSLVAGLSRTGGAELNSIPASCTAP